MRPDANPVDAWRSVPALQTAILDRLFCGPLVVLPLVIRWGCRWVLLAAGVSVTLQYWLLLPLILVTVQLVSWIMVSYAVVIESLVEHHDGAVSLEQLMFPFVSSLLRDWLPVSFPFRSLFGPPLFPETGTLLILKWTRVYVWVWIFGYLWLHWVFLDPLSRSPSSKLV